MERPLRAISAKMVILTLLAFICGHKVGSSFKPNMRYVANPQVDISSASLTQVALKPIVIHATRQEPASVLGHSTSREVDGIAALPNHSDSILPKVLGGLGVLGMTLGFLLLKGKYLQVVKTPMALNENWSIATLSDYDDDYYEDSLVHVPGGQLQKVEDKPAIPNPRYRCRTTMGDFVVELYLSKMPVTVCNFMDLADSGFYNGIHFHRVVEDFMVEFGCPHAKDPESPRFGSGGPPPNTIYRALDKTILRDKAGRIPDEFRHRFSNKPGTLSMANAGLTNSGGSQFFINLTDNDFLDYWRKDLGPSKHPVFGHVVEGYDVVLEISKIKTNRWQHPLTPIKMISITREPDLQPTLPESESQLALPEPESQAASPKARAAAPESE